MPRLIVINGASHKVFDLTQSKVRLGTDPENDVVLKGDPGVARRHCTIARANGAYLLRDKGAAVGTFINETRVGGEAKLTYGDRIRMGETVAIFVASEKGSGEAQVDQRWFINFVSMQEITKEILSEKDPDSLLEVIMDTAIRLIRAERGFLILLKGEAGHEKLEFKVARNIDYGLVQKPEFKISNGVIRQVVTTGEPILTSNAQQDLRDLKSIAALELRAVLCVPLRARGQTRPIGTLYLDSKDPDSRFDEEGRSLLLAFSDQAAIAIENARLLREEREKQAIQSELKVAATIQHELLPRQDPEIPGFSVSGRMETAREVGGDYYDFIWGPAPQGQKNIYFAIGDVSGKGVPAGLVMVMARSILRSLTARGAKPRDVLREANRLLKQDLKPGMFMSMILGLLNVPSGRLLLSGCGHERPLVYRRATGRVERLELGGLVLGIVDDNGPHLEESHLVLEQGDQLLLYTDGVTECMNPVREQYGPQRLERFLTRNGGLKPGKLLTGLSEQLHRHQSGTEQHDDITLVSIRRG